MTPAGIEPATLRFVAQHLNHCATAVHHHQVVQFLIIRQTIQLYDGRDMYRIYYIKNNYMFRHFTLAIFRLRNKKT